MNILLCAILSHSEKNGEVRKFPSAINYAIEIYFGNIILLYHIGIIPCSRIELPQLVPGIYPLKV